MQTKHLGDKETQLFDSVDTQDSVVLLKSASHFTPRICKYGQKVSNDSCDYNSEMRILPQTHVYVCIHTTIVLQKNRSTYPNIWIFFSKSLI